EECVAGRIEHGRIVLIRLGTLQLRGTFWYVGREHASLFCESFPLENRWEIHPNAPFVDRRRIARQNAPGRDRWFSGRASDRQRGGRPRAAAPPGRLRSRWAPKARNGHGRSADRDLARADSGEPDYAGGR